MGSYYLILDSVLVSSFLLLLLPTLETNEATFLSVPTLTMAQTNSMLLLLGDKDDQADSWFEDNPGDECENTFLSTIGSY